MAAPISTSALAPGQSLEDFQRIYSVYANGGTWDPSAAQGPRGGVYDPQGNFVGILAPPGSSGAQPGGSGSSARLNPQTGQYTWTPDDLPLGLSDAGLAGLLGGAVLTAGVGGGLLVGGGAAAAGAGAAAGAEAGAAGAEAGVTGAEIGTAGAELSTAAGATGEVGVGGLEAGGAAGGAGAYAGAGGAAGLPSLGQIASGASTASTLAKLGGGLLGGGAAVAGLVGGAGGTGDLKNDPNSAAILQEGRNLAVAGVPLQVSGVLEALAALRAKASGSAAEILPSIIDRLSALRGQYSGASQAIARKLGYAGGGQTEREQGKALAGATRQYGGLIQGEQQAGLAGMYKTLGGFSPLVSGVAREPSRSLSTSPFATNAEGLGSLLAGTPGLITQAGKLFGGSGTGGGGGGGDTYTTPSGLETIDVQPTVSDTTIPLDLLPPS